MKLKNKIDYFVFQNYFVLKIMSSVLFANLESAVIEMVEMLGTPWAWQKLKCLAVKRPMAS